MTRVVRWLRRAGYTAGVALVVVGAIALLPGALLMAAADERGARVGFNEMFGWPKRTVLP